MGGNAGGDLVDLGVARNLKPVGAVVVETAGVEQLVAEGDYLVAGGHRATTLRCSPMQEASSSTAGKRSAFIDSLMDTELYSIGAYFCDEHPELVDQVVGISVEIERSGLEAYAKAGDAPLEETFETLLTGLAVRYYKAVAG